ncbi:VOC family protein [Sphingomonas montanisoli]|uniref:Glyoxalase/bleomycin resistance/dioxygenase family protein n=1 Tax=Sphingomonas montanisoli TaxID=2606412 RepID=A0A5D9C0W7_9SPHN|nr:glyoxalase/bleomycin resistance/dioxygenase family protein [Sphingomonas montanisoli]TZG25073.1 glyoxalase/bleomycin resistance/dioxygenase family protein [Sphingomonas montanisoli]
MTLTAIFANISCSDLKRSAAWFTTLFDRGPDATPMPGLAEWHHGDTSGFQLFENADNAGRCTLTLIVSDVRAERDRVAALNPGEIETADYTTITRLHDPDGNLVVLAQPGTA